MRVVHKSNSMPSFNPQTQESGLSGKPRKHRLQDLEQEVNKSRIAIENMSHARAIQGNLYHQVEELQKELHKCILSLNSQSQRQKVLTQLTFILKGQMSAQQAVQKTSEEFVSCGIEKKIKKVEYDTKQILHKFNEEIAKINLLKEQANASRDQRVVYSNLFNKIQKEIKRYEQIYKQTLIKNQIFLDKKRSRSTNSNNCQELRDSDAIDESVDRFQSIEIMDSKPSLREIKMKELKGSKESYAGSSNMDLFLTNPKEFQTKGNNHSFLSHTYPKEINSPKQFTQSKDIEVLIKNREAAIEAVVVNAQCRNIEEVKKVYNSLDSQRDNMISQITNLDGNIDYVEQEIDRLIKQKRSSQVYENRQLTEIVNISKKTRANKAAVAETQQINPKQALTITKQICNLLGIEMQNLGDEVLRQIDSKIDSMGCTVIKKNERRGSRGAICEQISDRGVCDLLDKIQRFGQSEKIYDKNMLRAQYHKQVGKVKKKGKRTN